MVRNQFGIRKPKERVTRLWLPARVALANRGKIAAGVWYLMSTLEKQMGTAVKGSICGVLDEHQWKAPYVGAGTQGTD